MDFKNASLFSIIELIEKQTAYRFIYSSNEIDDAKSYDIRTNNLEVQKVVELLFRDSFILYEFRKKYIILSKRNNVVNNPNVQNQEKYSISGTISDLESGETLLGATIAIVGTSKGVVTNEYGFYSITLPAAKYKLRFTYLGYESKQVDIDLNKDQKLDIGLQLSSSELDEVVLTSEGRNHSQVRSVFSGVSNFRAAEIKQLPSLLGEPDVTRTLLTQPGVSTVGEGATGFNVRGGNIDQNLILLDEAPIYNSSHLWGFFSIFNSDAIKDLKLYKGGIPARFGGRASSVVDIRQREGSNKKFKGEGGIGLLFSRLTLEGPIKKEKLSFLVSGRRSYFDLFFPLLGEDLKDNKISFYDANTKLVWNINDKNKLFVSGYFGADQLKLSFDEELDAQGNPESEEKIDFNWGNATATLRWNHIFSSRLFLNVSGIYSRYNYRLSSENDEGGGPAGTTGSFVWKSTVENWLFKPDFTFYKDASTKIRFGVNNTLYHFTPANITSNETGINKVDFETEKGLEVAPYLEYEKKYGAFSLNAGFRYSWFANLGSYEVTSYDPQLPRSRGTITGTKKYGKGEVIKSYSGFEPRLALKYDLTDRKAIKFGYNRMFQYVHLISNTSAALPFDIWKPSSPHIKPLEVNQFSAGYAYDTPSGDYNFSMEGYYKTFKNIVEYKNGADLFINQNVETQLLPADGFSYGAELGIYKNRGKLTGNLNYTYSVTRRKTTGNFDIEAINNGKYYPSNFDRPHSLNLALNYKLGEKWKLGSFFNYQTGRPVTLPSGRVNIGEKNFEQSYLTYSNRNAYRIPDTHRMDISFTYTPNRPDKKWKSSWSFGLYNVYGNKNAFSTFHTFAQTYDSATRALRPRKLKAYQFSVIGSPIPFITYNFKF